MNICASERVADVVEELLLFEENDENVAPVNGCCDNRIGDEDVREVSGSQDMFSDDEQFRNTKFSSPKVTINTDTLNTSIISLKSPIFSKFQEETPGKPKVPRTPADLLPFITKTSLLWTSDMETPESKLNERSINCDKTDSSIKVNTTPKGSRIALDNEDVNIEKMDILTSPVLGGKKRSKRRAKRRILNNVALNLNTDETNSISSNDDRTSDISNPVTNGIVVKTELQIDKSTPKESNDTNFSKDAQENKKLKDAIVFDKNSNTSTQEFFCNASFSAIDQLCSTVTQEDKPNLVDYTSKNVINEVKEKIEIVENKEVENDVLERIAAIKRNKKPLRRLTDINHSIIPKEIFSASARDLELADAKLSQEKKPRNISEPLKSTSFIKLSALEDDLTSNENILIKKENEASQEIPNEIVDDWNAVDSNLKKVNSNINNNILSNVNQESDIKKETLDIKPEIENLVHHATTSNIILNNECKAVEENNHIKNELPDLNIDTNNTNVGFSTANGKNIAISEDKILDFAKIYKEIENENLNENVFMGIKKNRLTKLKLNTGKKNAFKPLSIGKTNENITSVTNEKPCDKSNNSNKLKLYEELDLQEFLQPKYCTESAEDGFTTATGKSIQISEDKVKHYSNVYTELNDIDEISLCNMKKNRILKSKMNIKSNDKALVVFDRNDNHLNTKSNNKMNNTSNVKHKPVEDSNTNSENAGFATAGGKTLKINSDKENYYAKVYNELNITDEKELFQLKMNKITKSKSKKNNDFKPLKFNNIENKKSTKEIAVAAPIDQNAYDGFSTAGGKNINVNEEKERHYLEIYNKLSHEINNENDIFNINKNNQLKPVHNNKPVDKVSILSNQKNNDDVATGTKLSISSDTDDVFYNLGDVEKLFAAPFQNNAVKIEKKNEDCFTVPSSTRVLKNVNQTSIVQQTMPVSTIVKEENIDESDTIMEMSNFKNLPESNVLMRTQVGLLKRKLENCDVKKQGRCRSFGGFTVNCKSPLACKLNKSDPLDEVYNQPLKNVLSVSQCFDAHSDSWLSKVEISYLNTSKIKSPDIRKGTIENEENSMISSEWKSGKFGDLLGFSFKECTESFRRYTKFERFLKKQHLKLDKCTEITVENNSTVSVSNHTLSKQQLLVYHENNVDMKNCESQYILTECIPKNRVMKNSELVATRTNGRIEKSDKIAEKRKHIDTDSDTPLTTLKKPRVGCELQGRKLFSDESDNEDSFGDSIDQAENQQIPLEAQIAEVVPEITDVDLSEERLEAVLKQEKIIRSKRKLKVKPIMGSLLKERLENSKNRKSWQELVGNSTPVGRNIQQIKENHLDAKILEVTASNAVNYKFLNSNIVGNKKVVSLEFKDGAKLIFDENGHAGVTEFADAFMTMPGVDLNLLPIGWVENHYRWIIWKLASIDRMSFNSVQLPKVLTLERVMKELKYRYDREIDRSERPALRRILEKDDASTRRMVLCISSIEEMTCGDDTDKEVRIKLGLQRWKIEATDGWYSIPLTIDNAMTNFILNGRVTVGTKIITYGAELLDCERGFYPLEKPANVSLKIYTNCTRRARWDTKLGFQKTSRPFSIKLKSVLTNGGMVGQTTVVAARVYPLLYREKTEDGRSIYRNARSEEKAAIAYERACELKADAMYAEAQKSFDSKKKSDSDEDIECSRATSERKQEEFKQKLESRMRQDLPPPRQVTPVLKIRLIDDKTTATLSIWGANEDSGYDIKEGNTITIYNAFASGSRGGEINLTANRFTHIKKESLLKLPYSSRTCTPIPDINPSIFEPAFNEFDTVGVVVSTGPAPYGMKCFEVVNLAYPKPNNDGSAYLSILFWNNVASSGYQSLFTAGTVLACSNLEWRRNTLWSIAVAYCSERSLFTCNPRQSYLSKEIRNLKSLIQNTTAYAESCVEEIENEFSKKLQPRMSQGTPVGSWSDRTAFHGNLSMISPSEVSTSLSIQRRLEKLSQYGGSLDVSPSLVLNNSSIRVKRDYTPVTPRSNV